MKSMLRNFSAITMLLIFALLIQNTCPRGYAGKSTVVASCSHCPYKQISTTPAKSGLNILSNHSAHMPLFVLAMPDPLPVSSLIAAAAPHRGIPNVYEDTLPKELLRPPQA
jgi:hypothetical protein